MKGNHTADQCWPKGGRQEGEALEWWVENKRKLWKRDLGRMNQQIQLKKTLKMTMNQIIM